MILILYVLISQCIILTTPKAKLSFVVLSLKPVKVAVMWSSSAVSLYMSGHQGRDGIFRYVLHG